MSLRQTHDLLKRIRERLGNTQMACLALDDDGMHIQIVGGQKYPAWDLSEDEFDISDEKLSEKMAILWSEIP